MRMKPATTSLTFAIASLATLSNAQLGFLSMFSAPSGLSAPAGFPTELALPTGLPSASPGSATTAAAATNEGLALTLAAPSQLSALGLPTLTLPFPSQLSALTQISGLGTLSLSLPTIITNSNPFPTLAFTLPSILPTEIPASLTAVLASTPSGLDLTGAVGALGGALNCVAPQSLGIQAFVQLPNVITVCVCIAPGASPCPTCPAGSQQTCSNGGCGCTITSTSTTATSTPATSTSVAPSTSIVDSTATTETSTSSSTSSDSTISSSPSTTASPTIDPTVILPTVTTPPQTGTVLSTATTQSTDAPVFTLPSGVTGILNSSTSSANNGGNSPTITSLQPTATAAGIFTNNGVTGLASPTPAACVVTQYVIFTTTVAPPICSTTTISSTVTVTQAVCTM